MSENGRRPHGFTRPQEWGDWSAPESDGTGSGDAPSGSRPPQDATTWPPPSTDSGTGQAWPPPTQGGPSRTGTPVGADPSPNPEPRSGGVPAASGDVDPSWAPPTAPAEHAASLRHGRARSRRPVRTRRSSTGTPVVTWTLIGLCVLVWLAELVNPSIADVVVLTPRSGRTEPWRFITSAFAHASGFAHIGFNMYALWVLGRSLEPFLGRARFLAAYMVSGLAGGALFVVMSTTSGDGNVLPGPDVGVVGASGAIFGLFGVLLIVQRRLGASTRELWIVLAINAGLLLVVPGIAWQAHLGGFLAGVASGVIFFEDPKRVAAGRKPLTWPRMAILTAVIIILVVVKYALT